MVQWLRFCTSKAGGPDSLPGQGARFCRLQLRTGLQSSKLKKKKKKVPGWIFLLCCFLLFSSVWETDLWRLISQASPALWSSVSFCQQPWPQQVREAEQRGVWVTESPPAPLLQHGPGGDHSSVGQPFVHSPSSQMNFKVVTITHWCLDASESSTGSFHLPLFF